MTERHPAQRAADTVIGAALSTAPIAGRITRLALVPVVVGWRLVRNPPLVPHQLTPAAITERWEVRGRTVRELTTDRTVDTAISTFQVMVPAVTFAVLDQLDVAELATRALPPETLTQVIEQLMPSALDTVLDQLDPVALAEQRVDPVVVEKMVTLLLPPIMESVLAQVDLTQLVRENVDLLSITNEVVDGVDLAGITNEVIDEIDLPGIIRESSSGVATEMVRGTRASAASADEAVARFFGRRRRDS